MPLNSWPLNTLVFSPLTTNNPLIVSPYSVNSSDQNVPSPGEYFLVTGLDEPIVAGDADNIIAV